jgi:hypothetical protein
MHPLIIIGKQTFDLLRSYWVKKMKDCDVCCCIYHVKMGELRVGFNHMRHKSRLHLEVHCECEKNCGPNLNSYGSCLDSHAIYPCIIALWEVFVYPL